MAECGARTRKGTPCPNRAMSNGRCRMHGGATPAGPASVHWKHGRYSGYLGQRTGQMLAEQLADPDRHSMAIELGLVDVRTAEVLQSLEVGQSVQAWHDLVAARAAFEAARARGQTRAMSEAFERISAAIDRGASATAGWRDVLDLIDRRRVLVESEEKRALAAGRAVPADQVAAMLQSLAAVVLDEIPDPAGRARVVERTRRLLQGHGVRQLPQP